MHKKKAKDEIRTRDPNLGKVMLYQLSYFRSIFLKSTAAYNSKRRWADSNRRIEILQTSALATWLQRR